ncbi:bifunctional indole-3-glycerol-phosphate synthase TrpC/phosphoribosylanthranilate isomerase TrpF [Symbiopectobacterium purcellii]|uniref:bifunctional indole-3-glycerol-phosphate synthase TrpC/phosphoribosylanthranilate isomerase TrpF n=1 Tax=Symbiopectobacterium purcellii TaxID=2871826 RepID=UPI002076BAF2|nr:bifunctional indole-3-glycerol-phosphate synthase TrpC/phosphoribosylanthranilate isomerase TrpF [Symbiopectobacterium purcellii]
MQESELNKTVLGKIVKDKVSWIVARQQAQPLSSFQADLVPSQRDFYAALKHKKPAFILECKKASPSKGLIREDFDPVAIARVYSDYASAISVLTDEKYFQGSFDFLPRISAVVRQPVLCKDFIILEYQIYLARHYQADAILLMLSVLDDHEYRELAQVAHSLKMGVLTEVSNEAELERAIALNARVVGINNRDLRDLSIDLERTRTLAPRLPKNVTVISESGIHNAAQIRELSAYANGFLVGSSLMSEPNLSLAVRRLILGENKVCGLTRAIDAAAAYNAGAVYGGLIFVPSSPRCVTPEFALTVMSGAPLRYVGVFRNAPAAEIAQTARQLGLFAVQLHGNENQTAIDDLRALLPTACQIWKALSVEKKLPKRDFAAVNRYLFDNGQGGSGERFDWNLLHDADLSNVLLAGGVNVFNSAKAAQFGCAGLDVNSGVESEPGIKDAVKIHAAFAPLYPQ